MPGTSSNVGFFVTQGQQIRSEFADLVGIQTHLRLYAYPFIKNIKTKQDVYPTKKKRNAYTKTFLFFF